MLFQYLIFIWQWCLLLSKSLKLLLFARFRLHLCLCWSIRRRNWTIRSADICLCFSPCNLPTHTAGSPPPQPCGRSFPGPLAPRSASGSLNPWLAAIHRKQTQTCLWAGNDHIYHPVSPKLHSCLWDMETRHCTRLFLSDNSTLKITCNHMVFTS